MRKKMINWQLCPLIKHTVLISELWTVCGQIDNHVLAIKGWAANKKDKKKKKTKQNKTKQKKLWKYLRAWMGD